MSRQPDVTLTQLRYFAEAASALSMTRAAEELRVAQSAVSSAVAQLERQVGTPLFLRRHARGLVLTAAGEELLRDVRELLAHVGEVLDAARGRGEEVRGHITLACMVTLVPFVLPELLADLGATCPGLEVEVLELEAAAVSSALRSGTVEVAVTYELGLGPDVAREVVAEVPPYVVLPPGHRLAAREDVRLADLADEPMVLLDLPHSREYFRELLAAAGAPPRIAYRSSSVEAVRGMVARGLGFSLLNQRPVLDGTYGGGRVEARPVAGEVPSLSVVVAWMESARRTARARAVTDSAREIARRLGSGRAAPGDEHL
ncbi:LysR family transcriptional regulator (plasmid) [Pseudonocardia sp. EC080610-09]|uniref:LysR family transcriptional regulator n=1 Tax=unclassified Pseudonocardia TaxID=2619320 RepID=UPI0007058A34|nr:MULTISPECIES: LysR family transcriptional regulator [unclassified Pseudonocardia]ALL79288.1 LysR family transcriptional regulator [Pseudonocardia sp. EC080610-09]ALL85258.1 LysR family transcriptional regulator [Pseudonocardia sp. EC080619-01]